MSTYTTVRELQQALLDAMHPRADGSRHLKDCFNRSVNSQMYPCSPRCVAARKALHEGEQWLMAPANRPTVPIMVVPNKA